MSQCSNKTPVGHATNLDYIKEKCRMRSPQLNMIIRPRTRFSMITFWFRKAWVFAGDEKSSRVAMLASPNDTSSPMAKVASDRIYR